jgi:hypothetical protein
MDNGGWKMCESGQSFGGGAVEGFHSLQVRAVDTLYHFQFPPALSIWVIDTVPPVATITSDTLVNGYSSGSVTFHLFTNDPSATGQCQLSTSEHDDSNFVTCASTTSAVYTGLTNGVTYWFSYKVVDRASNAHTVSRSFIVDDVAPILTITATTPASVVITNNGHTQSRDISFTFTGVDNGGSGFDDSSFECQFDNDTTFTSCTSPVTKTALDDGAHTIVVTCNDMIGNTATKSFKFTIDTIAPVPSISSGPSEGSYSNSNSATFIITTTGDTTTFECQLSPDDSAFSDCPDPNGSNEYTFSGLTDNSYILTVRVCDAATNCATISRSWIVGN